MSNISVFDVANYILEKPGDISAMKLQKLVYYSQAWSLVWDDKPLFKEKIEAWTNGPVVRVLYEQLKGLFQVEKSIIAPLAKCQLSDIQKDTIDLVLNAYGNKSPQWLTDQTHSEPPWQIARNNLSDTERGENEITLESMAEYYGSL